MKKLLTLGVCVIGLVAFAGLARAVDLPTKQEGRIWVDANLLLKISPNWSWTTMPGARDEFYRSREGNTGLHFLELFTGPDYTYKFGDFTFKGSLWYYYMGYPQRGRMKEQANGTLACSTPPIGSATYCTSTYNASHNIEIIPSLEYRFGRWSIYDRVILHNTFYADVYNTPYTDPDNAAKTLSVGSQRLGWATVLRELLRVRYALTDKLGVWVADEIFVTLLEDGDTSGMKRRNADGSTTKTGYNPMGYWKSGLRYNRTYFGIDYPVTSNLVIAPSYMIEIGLNPVDSGDITDIAHTFFMVATMSTSLFDPPAKK
jgi:hypothetical protein